MKTARLLYFLGIAAACLWVLAGCSEFEHGSVNGRVVSAVDGAPIQGAAIGIGSEHGVTGFDGHFGISGIRTGRKEMIIRAEGWVLPGETLPVNVIKGVTALGDIALVPETDIPPVQPAL